MNRGADTTVVMTDLEHGTEEPSTYPATQPLDWSGVLAQQGYVFGVDICADGERVVLADVRGNVLGRNTHLRQQSAGPDSSLYLPYSPDEVIARTVAMMRDLLKKKGVKGRELLRIGVGFGGPVDSRLGVVRTAHDAPDWEGFPVAAHLESHFDATTLLENDARLAALGELWFGIGHTGGRKADAGTDIVYVHWSTGVGGGIVADGRLLRGATTIAGEVGHTVVRTGDDALPCRCGGRGHLEAYVRAPALLQRAAELSSQLPVAAAPAQDVATLFAQAAQNEVLRRLVDEAVEMMAVTVGNLITTMNPDLAVIGGRVAREGAHLVPRIADLARNYAMPVSAQDVTIAPAALGEEATVMGAVALALDSLR
jgi:glucokinase